MAQDARRGEGLVDFTRADILVILAIMQEPDGLSLAALRRLTTANWSEQEKFLGLTKQQESC